MAAVVGAARLAYFLLASGDTFRRKFAQLAGPTLAWRRITIEILAAGRALLVALAVFVALLFFGGLWGGWGLPVGVPLLATIKTAAERIVPLRAIGALISR